MSVCFPFVTLCAHLMFWVWRHIAKNDKATTSPLPPTNIMASKVRYIFATDVNKSFERRICHAIKGNLFRISAGGKIARLCFVKCKVIQNTEKISMQFYEKALHIVWCMIGHSDLIKGLIVRISRSLNRAKPDPTQFHLRMRHLRGRRWM